MKARQLHDTGLKWWRKKRHSGQTNDWQRKLNLSVCWHCSTYKSWAEEKRREPGSWDELWFKEFLHAEMRWGKRFMLCCLHHHSYRATEVRLIMPSHSCIRGSSVVSALSGFVFPGQCFAAVIKLLISFKLIAFPGAMNQPTLSTCFLALSPFTTTWTENQTLLPAQTHGHFLFEPQQSDKKKKCLH